MTETRKGKGRYSHLYKTKAWYRLRYKQLQAQPLCEFCLKRNVYSEATIADHIRKHRGNEELFHNPANLQSLCKRCHDSTKQYMENNNLSSADHIGHDANGISNDPSDPWHQYYKKKKQDEDKEK